MRESVYQYQIMRRLEETFPGCVVMKNDSSLIQGIPDLIIVFRDRWAMLEVKTSARATIQPNQEFYINWLNELSFAAFIYPENEEEVFDALQRSFEYCGASRSSQS